MTFESYKGNGQCACSGAGSEDDDPVTKDILMASADCVAIDAVAAKMMVFEPKDHKFIRLARERGLGTGKFDEIEIVGDVDAARKRWGFSTGDNAALCVGKLFWFGPMRWLEKLMFHTPLVYCFIFASAVYHDKIWYPSNGRKVVNKWLGESPWGRVFTDYKVGG